MSVDKQEFANDVVLVVSIRKAAVSAGRAYVRVARMLGLKVRLCKTKFMVVWYGLTDDDRMPLHLEDGGTVESVSQFPYLGSLIAESGQSHDEVNRRITNACKAFVALRQAVC